MVLIDDHWWFIDGERLIELPIETDGIYKRSTGNNVMYLCR